VGISLNVSNVVGYTRCQKDAAGRLQAMAGRYLGQSLAAHQPAADVRAARAGQPVLQQVGRRRDVRHAVRPRAWTARRVASAITASL
jgi:hypothetical protein